MSKFTERLRELQRMLDESGETPIEWIVPKKKLSDFVLFSALPAIIEALEAAEMLREDCGCRDIDLCTYHARLYKKLDALDALLKEPTAMIQSAEQLDAWVAAMKSGHAAREMPPRFAEGYRRLLKVAEAAEIMTRRIDGEPDGPILIPPWIEILRLSEALDALRAPGGSGCGLGSRRRRCSSRTRILRSATTGRSTEPTGGHLSDRPNSRSEDGGTGRAEPGTTGPRERRDG